MSDRLVYGLTFISALGSGLAAGIFFAFSTFIMRGLARMPAPQGIAAMQSINVTVINPLFMGVFLGTAVLGLVLGVLALFRWNAPGSGWILTGSILYLVGVILVTFIFNVPRNDALAAVNPASPEGAALWSTYVREWTAWNHVRTVAPLAAMASFILALGWLRG